MGDEALEAGAGAEHTLTYIFKGFHWLSDHTDFSLFFPVGLHMGLIIHGTHLAAIFIIIIKHTVWAKRHCLTEHLLVHHPIGFWG